MFNKQIQNNRTDNEKKENARPTCMLLFLNNMYLHKNITFIE